MRDERALFVFLFYLNNSFIWIIKTFTISLKFLKSFARTFDIVYIIMFMKCKTNSNLYSTWLNSPSCMLKFEITCFFLNIQVPTSALTTLMNLILSYQGLAVSELLQRETVITAKRVRNSFTSQVCIKPNGDRTRPKKPDRSWENAAGVTTSYWVNTQNIQNYNRLQASV